MVGGMLSSAVLTLIVIPAIYALWKERAVRRHERFMLASRPPG